MHGSFACMKRGDRGAVGVEWVRSRSGLRGARPRQWPRITHLYGGSDGWVPLRDKQRLTPQVAAELQALGYTMVLTRVGWRRGTQVSLARFAEIYPFAADTKRLRSAELPTRSRSIET